MNFADKYSPQNLTEVIYLSTATQAVINAYANGHRSGHILLWGPNGTGKSTVARLLIEAIGGSSASVETKSYDELVAIKDLKGYLKRAIHTARLFNTGKHFILIEELDEADSKKMSKLWTAMDACGTDLVVIATTNHWLKIHASMRSRMNSVSLPAIKPTSVLPRAQQLLASEGINLPDAQVLHYLTTMAMPQDLRGFMGLLDDIHSLVVQGIPLPAYPTSTPPKPKLTVA